ncbi:glycoside hydrolase family 99-like domain-containing protein [Georgenia sp. H159]|uniref:glycosyltransferase WbsX family protein n=1 Tax=Georgenia sp. H159 TaxID=3076115 RepID=UPI003A5CDF92
MTPGRESEPFTLHTSPQAPPAQSPSVLAFYLPQYHPIPENDEWWGSGFTEWRNVARAKPLYRGHRQPKLPGDLSFYDLRVPEVRQAQADLARRSGVTGFVYWHYWFGDGRRLLERPFNEVLRSGEPDFPFALAWANESWSRRWYGDERTILMEQRYPGIADYEAHFRSLVPAFSDTRYIRVDGKPLFYVYRPRDLPSPLEFTDTFRRCAERAGFGDLYLVAGDSTMDPANYGFDASYAQPNLLSRRALASNPRSVLAAASRMTVERGGPVRISYRRLMREFESRETRPWTEHRAVMPNWDNTPRRFRGGIVLTGSSPSAFKSHIRSVVRYTHGLPAPRRLLFLKSWNEWAEGNYVEPDEEYGHGWLDSLREVLVGAPPEN